MQNIDARKLSRGAIIAALYVLTTFLTQPLSFGPVQLRLAEALCVLPLCLSEAVPGVTAGCLLANLLLGGVWYDVIFGTLSTLLAALLTRRLHEKRLAAALMPAITNGAIVGPVVYLAYTPGTGMLALLTCVGGVMLGEAVVCVAAGLPLARLAERLLKR